MSKEDEKGEALSTMHFTSHHPDTERFQHRDKTHGKRNKPDYSDSSDDDILIASVPVLCSPAKKLRPSIVKSHAVSDSDSDTELPIPLSERLNQQKMLPMAAKPAEDQHRFVNNNMKNMYATSTNYQQSSAASFNPCEDIPVLESDDVIPEMLKIKRPAPARRKSGENLADKQLEKTKKKEELEQKKRQKEEEKEKRKQEQDDKRQHKEYEVAKKKTLRETQKSSRPGEAIKHVTVMLDPAILKSSSGTVILETLQKLDITYEIQPQPLAGIITFWREVTQVVEKQPLRLETEKKEVVEDEILLIMPVDLFVSLVHNFKQNQMSAYTVDESLTLREHIVKVRRALENRKVTLLIQEIEKYFKEQQNQGQRKYRSQVTGQEAASRKKKKNAPSDVDVSRLDVEEALIDAQLHTGCSVRFVASDIEMGKTVLQYTKAVADAPFKRDRLNNGLSLYIENSGSMKISKEGLGVQQAWRQQLQQFKNVKAEVANAIMGQYCSPIELWKAYRSCSSHREAELLLQDLVIRRGVGVMATSRRVGKELSRRLYQLFTSEDPNLVLK